MYCGFCGKNTHTIVNCPKTAGGSINRSRMYCVFCGLKDHNVEACPKTFSGNAARAWHPESVADHFIKDQKQKGK